MESVILKEIWSVARDNFNDYIDHASRADVHRLNACTALKPDKRVTKHTPSFARRTIGFVVLKTYLLPGKSKRTERKRQWHLSDAVGAPKRAERLKLVQTCGILSLLKYACIRCTLDIY